MSGGRCAPIQAPGRRSAERLTAVGVDVVGGSAEAFGERLKREFATYGAAMKASGVEPQ